jgi:hypothetical protein
MIKCGHCKETHNTVNEVRVCAVPRPANAPVPQAKCCNRCNGTIEAHELYQAITGTDRPIRCMNCAREVNGAGWVPTWGGFAICQGDHMLSYERFTQIFG